MIEFWNNKQTNIVVAEYICPNYNQVSFITTTVIVIKSILMIIIFRIPYQSDPVLTLVNTSLTVMIVIIVLLFLLSVRY